MIEEEESSAPAEEGSPAWMATFADMMSLLLTFFVLILSFANMDVIKFSAAVESLQDAFGQATVVERLDGSPLITPITFESSGLPLIANLEQCSNGSHTASLRRRVESLVRRLNLHNLVEVDEADGGVVVRVVGQLLFDPGSVELRPESFVLLNEISILIHTLSEAVSIEGHTDETPMASGDGISNWHLSTGRAISVLEYLVDVRDVDEQRLSVSGHAATQPLYSNDTAKSRERNRRVEFVFRADRIDDSQNTASR